MAGYDIGLDIASRCLGCGADRPMPAREEATRCLTEAGDPRCVYLDTDKACARCGGRRVEVRLSHDL